MANRKRSFVDTQLSLGSTNADSVQSADMEERDYRTPLPQKPLQWKRRKDDRSLSSYFIRKDRNNNRSFFWDNEWDKHRLTCTFWADKQMQLDYYSFGDSVYFDTTYRSIETCRPLALFVGYNHHRQLCVFGAALIYDETIETFQWLFKAFISCMCERRPESIFTDQCDGIANAIKTVLPDTFHGLCTFRIIEASKIHWTALQRLQRRILCDTGFLKQLSCLVDDVVDEDEFDLKWTEMIETYFSGQKSTTDAGRKWLEHIHGFREQWSSAWVREFFSAGMNNSEFGKMCDTILRRILEPEFTLVEFFTHFDRMVEGQRAVEKLSELEEVNKELYFQYPSSPITDQAAREYTPAIFQYFLDEYNQSIHFEMDPLSEDDPDSVKAYRVFRGETDEGFVAVDSANGELSCSCCLFDSSGWLCRHALKVMQQSPIYNDHNMLRATVSQYIMERWAKKAKSIGELSALKLVEGPLLYTLRDQHLVTMLGRLDRRVERHEKAYNMVYYGVSALMKCARDLIESTSVNSESS